MAVKGESWDDVLAELHKKAVANGPQDPQEFVHNLGSRLDGLSKKDKKALKGLNVFVMNVED